jgi:hypothetical protein
VAVRACVRAWLCVRACCSCTRTLSWRVRRVGRAPPCVAARRAQHPPLTRRCVALRAHTHTSLSRARTRRGLAVEEFALLLLSVGEYIAARRGLAGSSKEDALAGKRAEVRAGRACVCVCVCVCVC